MFLIELRSNEAREEDFLNLRMLRGNFF